MAGLISENRASHSRAQHDLFGFHCRRPKPSPGEARLSALAPDNGIESSLCGDGTLKQFPGRIPFRNSFPTELKIIHRG